MSRINARLVLPSLLAFALLALPALSAHTQALSDPFADSVVSSSGLGSNPLYNNPAATLGQPATLINGIFDNPPGIYHTSMVYPAYVTDPNGNDVITSLGSNGSVTVKFNTPIVHSDQHWYGDDFIVYGNSYFPSSSGITPTTNMANVTINGTGSIYQNGTPTISVSADGINFVTLAPTVWYPTNPYAWVGISAANPSGWNDSALQNFSQPVNPALGLSAFAGVSVANAANNLYDGSAGGAAFSLAGLTDANGNPLTSIQYIRFTGDGSGGTNDIDAVSRVSSPFSATPEPSAGVIAGIGLAGVGILRRRRVRA